MCRSIIGISTPVVLGLKNRTPRSWTRTTPGRRPRGRVFRQSCTTRAHTFILGINHGRGHGAVEWKTVHDNIIVHNIQYTRYNINAVGPHVFRDRSRFSSRKNKHRIQSERYIERVSLVWYEVVYNILHIYICTICVLRNTRILYGFMPFFFFRVARI